MCFKKGITNDGSELLDGTVVWGPLKLIQATLSHNLLSKLNWFTKLNLDGIVPLVYGWCPIFSEPTFRSCLPEKSNTPHSGIASHNWAAIF